METTRFIMSLINRAPSLTQRRDEALIMLACLFFSIPAHAAKTSCAALFEPTTTFAELLHARDYDAAADALRSEKIKVTEQINHLPEHELMAIRKHWAGVETGVLISTPVYELVTTSFSMNFKAGETLIDIGSGHGDPGLVFGALNPSLKVIGYDLVSAKVDGANRLASKFGLKNIRFMKQDLSDPNFRLPFADYFYFFNPVNIPVLEKVLSQIQEMAKSRRIRLVIYGGGLTPKVVSNRGFVMTAEIGFVDIYEYLPELKASGAVPKLNSEVPKEANHRLPLDFQMRVSEDELPPAFLKYYRQPKTLIGGFSE